jgi:pimeloyl-ACP methyl ester carboxylesterase
MKVIVKDLATEYLDEGSGPVMLLLHGWKDNLHTFDPLMPELVKMSRVIRLDLPGFGASELPKVAWYLNDYVEFIKAFCQKLDISPEILGGHSLGGRIVIKSVSDNQMKPKKIILIASAGLAKSQTVRNRSITVMAKIGKIITLLPPFIFWRNSLRKKLYQKAGSDYLAAGEMQQTFLNIIQEDLSTNAARIKVPTLLIWGESDTETPPADALTLNRLIKGSRLEFLSGAGHFVHREKPALVSQLIWEFDAK